MAFQGLCSRADLIKCLGQHGEEGLKEQAIFWSYAQEPQTIELKLPPIEIPGEEPEGEVPPEPEPAPVIEAGRRAATFYRITACEKSDLLPEVIPGADLPRPGWFENIPEINLEAVQALKVPPLNKQPLAAWARLWPFLYRLLSTTVKTTRPDIPLLVNKVAQGQWLKQIPQQTRRHWAGNLCILLDRNARVFAFNRDYTDLLQSLEKLRGPIGLDIQTLLDMPGGAVRIMEQQSQRVVPWRMPLADKQIFILSDLGLLDETRVATRAWLTFGQQLRAKGFCPAVLLPVPAQAIPRELTDVFDCFSWDRHSRFQRLEALLSLDDSPVQPQENAVKELLALLSPALIVEPTLLRAVRHLLPAADYDVGIEVAAWLHRDVEPTPLGFYYRPEAIKSYLREFANKAQTDRQLIREVCRLIIEHHQHLFPTQRYEEIATLAQLTGFELDGLAEAARKHRLQLIKATEQHSWHAGLDSWGYYYLARQESSNWINPELSALWGILQSRKNEAIEDIPDYVKLAEALPFLCKSSNPAFYVLQQRGDELQIHSPQYAYSGEAVGAKVQLLSGSPLTRFETRLQEIVLIQERVGKIDRQVVKLTNNSPTHYLLLPDIPLFVHAGGRQYRIESFTKPAWAVAIGNDEQGLYTETRSRQGEFFRWYWFPPGLEAKEQLAGFWYAAGPEMPPKPDWASTTGRDQYGLYADLNLRSITQRFRWIAPGDFLMGSPETEPEREPWDEGNETQHAVTLTQGYWLADTACTQAIWQAVMGGNPAHFKDNPGNPVETVSWDDVRQFIAKLNELVPNLNACLPTEAQWEYACRAGTNTPFSFGENISPEQVNYNGEYPYAGDEKGLYRHETVPVGSLPPNPWGLYEMHGNVLEWCSDWYEHYPSGPATDPRGPHEGADRVLRGGYWFNRGRSVRSANRSRQPPALRRQYFGFRLALGQTA